jgi:RNA-directed DNA polymerase
MSRRVPYALDQCALYAVTSPTMLAKRLDLPLADLEELANRSDNYLVRPQRKASGKVRWIEEPKARLQRIHGRVHQLLSRVDLPQYVHSVRRGHSYITNARQHLGNGEMVKLDLEKFYVSVRSGAVAAFFEKQMRCAPDVAGLLARLLTYKGHLPTGSKSSPILSYFTHKALFDAIAGLAAERGLTMTLYVDDVVISGAGAHRGLMAAIRQIISAHGLRSHKLRHFAAKRPKIVTGVMVAQDGLRLPNRRHQRIKDGYTELHPATTSVDKLTVLNWLGSLVHEAAQIDSRHRPSAIQLDALRRQLRAAA